MPIPIPLRKKALTTNLQPMPDEKPVSLNPLDLKRALKGLLDIPDPEATKPKGKARPKRKKTPPTPEKE